MDFSQGEFQDSHSKNDKKMSFVRLDGHHASSSSSASLYSNNSISSSTSTHTATSLDNTVARSDAVKKRLRVMEVFCKQSKTCDPTTGKMYFNNAMEYGNYIQRAEDIIHRLIAAQTVLDVQRAEGELDEERRKVTAVDKDLINRMKEQERNKHETAKRKSLEEPTWGVALDSEQSSLRDKDGNQVYAFDVKRAKTYREVDETIHKDKMNRKRQLTTIEKERMMGHDRKLSQSRAKSELNNSMNCFIRQNDHTSSQSTTKGTSVIVGENLFK